MAQAFGIQLKILPKVIKPKERNIVKKCTEFILTILQNQEKTYIFRTVECATSRELVKVLCMLLSKSKLNGVCDVVRVVGYTF